MLQYSNVRGRLLLYSEEVVITYSVQERLFVGYLYQMDSPRMGFKTQQIYIHDCVHLFHNMCTSVRVNNDNEKK